ncbi:hypothetical protein ACTPEF_24150, partial [Clostridioides difficile]
VLAVAQSAKETGFCNFGGVLDASFKNPCGLKTSVGGSDTDKNLFSNDLVIYLSNFLHNLMIKNINFFTIKYKYYLIIKININTI